MQANYIESFLANKDLINTLGLDKAHLIWTLGLCIEQSDLSSLASEALTDGGDDKKIDAIYLDRDIGKIIIAQGYYSSKTSNDAAPSNKACDLNTAAAWLLNGNINNIPNKLKSIITECRNALKEGEIESIDLFYIHNLPESVNVARELNTVESNLTSSLKELNVSVQCRELGRSQIDNLFQSQDSHIQVKEAVICPTDVKFSVEGPRWKASVLNVPGAWLHELFKKHGDLLFSANYRGFLGITSRRKINSGIKTTAEASPNDFWVFNNGITLLTTLLKAEENKSELKGVSIINGAQTTGSLGSVDTIKHDLQNVNVLCRIIECNDKETIQEIVRYNNTQNEITTWDAYSNDADQQRIEDEFKQLGYSYNRKRGFKPNDGQISIEDVIQALIAFQGDYELSNRGKNGLFNRKQIYNNAFSGVKARHILFVHTLAKAIDERRLQLKKKSNENTIIPIEERQLMLLRNLRCKFFLVSLIGNIIETIIDKKASKKTVSFLSENANTAKHNMSQLIAFWSPIVESTLTFLTTKVTIEKFSEEISEDKALERISSDIEALIYTNRDKPEFKKFSQLVSES